MSSPGYRGRFAPSPTGPLHFGSLVAAVASYADARSHQGEWLVRIEDVDQARRKPDAEQDILDTLAVFGMQWDRPPARQSERGELYLDALDRLIAQRLAYRCNCSRKVIAAMARVGLEGPIYPGTCRSTPPPGEGEAAWRVAVDAAVIGFHDRVVGETRQDLVQEIGDFVIHRLDGFAAYQLAVVVDDHAQGITDVVRGADLLWSTPRQIWLQKALDLRTPRYAHIPLAYGSDGHKLSKRDQAHPVDETHPVKGLRAAWAHLGQEATPQRLRTSADFWDWAIPRWDIARVPHDRNRRHERSDSL